MWTSVPRPCGRTSPTRRLWKIASESFAPFQEGEAAAKTLHEARDVPSPPKPPKKQRHQRQWVAAAGESGAGYKYWTHEPILKGKVAEIPMSCCAGTDSRDQVRYFSSQSCGAGADVREQLALCIVENYESTVNGVVAVLVSGKFFRIQCDVWLDSGYLPRRQFTKACAIILHISA